MEMTLRGLQVGLGRGRFTVSRSSHGAMGSRAWTWTWTEWLDLAGRQARMGARMTQEVFTAVMQVFGVFAVGWFARHKGYLDDRDIGRMTALSVDFLYPLLIFNTIVTGFDPSKLRSLWPLPVIGFGLMAVGAVLGYGFKLGVKSKDVDVIKTFHHFCCTNNFGFLPIIIVLSLWKEEGLAMLFLLNLGSNVAYWTLGVGLLGESSLRKAAGNLLTPTLVTLLATLALCLAGLQVYVPEVALRISGQAGSAAIPLQLVLIGASLYPLPRMVDKQDLIYLTVVRLLVLPALLVGILLAIPLEAGVRNVGIVVALMPVSVSTVVIARRYGGCPDFAARAALLTTLVSMATIPLGMWLLAHYGWL